MNDADLELLSAYLDDQLDASSRAALETRLAADPDLQRELEGLRATVALVGGLPQLRAPRPLTLDKATARAARPARILPFVASGAFTAASAAAALILIVAGILTARPPVERPSQANEAPAVAVLPTTTSLAASTELMLREEATVIQATPTFGIVSELRLADTATPTPPVEEQVSGAAASSMADSLDEMTGTTPNSEMANEAEAASNAMPFLPTDALFLTVQPPAANADSMVFSAPEAAGDQAEADATIAEGMMLQAVAPTASLPPTRTKDDATTPAPPMAAQGSQLAASTLMATQVAAEMGALVQATAATPTAQPTVPPIFLPTEVPLSTETANIRTIPTNTMTPDPSVSPTITPTLSTPQSEVQNQMSLNSAAWSTSSVLSIGGLILGVVSVISFIIGRRRASR